MQQWFTLSEAAEKSGLGNTTIRSKVQSGEIRAVKRPSKHGQRWEISQDALNDFLRAQIDLPLAAERPSEAHGDQGGVRGLTIKTHNPDPYASSEQWPRVEPSTSSEASERMPSEASASIINSLRDELSALRTENSELKRQLASSKSLVQDECARQLESSARAECAIKIIQEAQSRVELMSQSKRPFWKRLFYRSA